MARIDHYEFGRIVIDGGQETRDLIILPDRVVRHWWRRDGHALVADDRGVTVAALPTSPAVRRLGDLAPASTPAALHLTC